MIEHVQNSDQLYHNMFKGANAWENSPHKSVFDSIFEDGIGST